MHGGNVLNAQLMEVPLLGVRTVIRLEMDAGTAKGPRQATNGYIPTSSVPVLPCTFSAVIFCPFIHMPCWMYVFTFVDILFSASRFSG